MICIFVLNIFESSKNGFFDFPIIHQKWDRFGKVSKTINYMVIRGNLPLLNNRKISMIDEGLFRLKMNGFEWFKKPSIETLIGGQMMIEYQEKCLKNSKGNDLFSFSFFFFFFLTKI